MKWIILIAILLTLAFSVSSEEYKVFVTFQTQELVLLHNMNIVSDYQEYELIHEEISNRECARPFLGPSYIGWLANFEICNCAIRDMWGDWHPYEYSVKEDCNVHNEKLCIDGSTKRVFYFSC